MSGITRRQLEQAACQAVLSITQAATVALDLLQPQLTWLSDDWHSEQLTQSSKAFSEDIAALAFCTERGYVFRGVGTRQARQPSFYKEIIRATWRPEVLNQQLVHQWKQGYVEADLPYNRLWIDSFRISYESFQYIKKAIAPRLRPSASGVAGAPKPLSPGEQLAICLYWLAHGGEYHATARALNRSVSSVHRCVVRVCDAIVTELAPKHVVFPRTVEELHRNAVAFERLGRGEHGDRNGLPMIAGSVDGSHIPINCPDNGGDEYINRKGTHSILLQAVVDAAGKFIDAHVGWSGRIHDARLWAESDLGKDLDCTDGGPPGPRSQLMASQTIDMFGQPVNYMLVADSAYNASRFVLPAFKDSDANNPARRRFNRRLATTRGRVERSLGGLKQRWRVLLKPQMLDVSNVVKVVMACVVLHNICIERNFPEPEVDEATDPDWVYYRQMYPTAASNSDGSAAARNDRACNTDAGVLIRRAFVAHINRAPVDAVMQF